MSEISISPLGHTWLLDLDGTLLKQNGFKNGGDEFLPGALEFLRSIPEKDCIVFLTARENSYRRATEDFLNQHEIAYHHIIFDLPNGERIMVNDIKNSGLKTAIAVNVNRDAPVHIDFFIDVSL
ncbi:hypothetical protein [Comamonas aquatica]|uniref:hypothetical protein n=1 Tax=Comamonas aquatica TaxID=225991 RepID=UPI0024495D5C|nr:hypothetical protein [Comamonas aquatica]MDH1674373.1 HAD family acid phosphatase [Comamonas aquatica]MDH1677925.1 HAD family acid phosphatase [Comamonas aquatica]